ncbi:MAG TPA: hypothetical protein PLX89_08235 [Verrucomicrobiota bacterium]|nr:hypothetical protein [Verrucomicrobiales bacterium]HRI12978.1 hypothetical protein [Verrucomicrobiota bacterium]
MDDLKPEIESVTVVLVGDFNPAIFHPAWFAHQKLIQQEEADRASVKIVSPDLSVFSIGWLALEVVSERFAVQTTQMQYVDALRDFVTGTFGLLRHTPVKFMGVNRAAHFRSPDETTWHNLGHRLAPKEEWETVLKKPGMRKLQILGQRPDQFRGNLNVTVEPSQMFRPGFGVLFDINDHYDNDVEGKGRECERMMEILVTAWQISLDRSLRIAQTIVQPREPR